MAAVTWPRSGPDQLEDLLRQLLMAVDPPAPIPEVPPRREVVTASSDRDTESAIAGRQSSDAGGIRADAAVVYSLDSSRHSRPLDSDPSDGIGTMWCVSHVGSRVMLRSHPGSRKTDGGRRRRTENGD